MFTPKERLRAAINGKEVDRPPVICPGGMMNSAIVDVIKNSGVSLPEAHCDSELMADLAFQIQNQTGFENFGIPFCMTVEAESNGSKVDFGDIECEPKIVKERFPDSKSVIFEDIGELLKRGRVPVVVKAARKLSREHPDIPVIVTLTGPISYASSIVKPMAFFKDLRKDSENSCKVLEYVVEFLKGFITLAVENGADVIAFADPTATGEILGPKMFEKYVVRYMPQVVLKAHDLGAKTILHICGDVKPVRHLLPEIGADLISTDAVVSLFKLKKEFPGIKTMGNLSTFLLNDGPIDKIKIGTKKLVEDKIDVIAPACGLSTSTPLKNIRAFTDKIKE
ncbi:MtaA/CmuA family methyltransferase [Clostridium sp. JNZ X4-2]